MTQIRTLRALSLSLTFGILLAASCAREDDSTNAGGSSQGGSGHGGGGASSKAGSPSGAFGGTTGSGGKGGTGSSVGEAGDTAAAGSENSAGAGGTSTIPPDVLERARVIVLYQTSTTAASSKDIEMKLHVVNKSPDKLPMASVKIRYWFTAEATPTLHQYYVASQLQGPSAVFVEDGANSHALMAFTGGQIALGDDLNFSEIQLKISNNISPFNQADDHSFDGTASTDKPNLNITLYLDERLIWGCEPSGVCSSDSGAGGAGAGGAGAGGASPVENMGGAGAGATGTSEGGAAGAGAGGPTAAGGAP